MTQEDQNATDKPVPAETAPAKPKGESKVSVIAAIIGNIAVGVVKFIAAAISGSTAMFSEGIHSIVDSGNGILILFGMHQAKREPNMEHPFGYGKELYFWTLVVSLLIFALGGCFSISEGYGALTAAAAGNVTLGDPTVSYVVIVAAMIIEGTSLSVALKQFNAARGTTGPLQFIRDAKDPALYTVVLEDSAAEAGLVFALLGIFLGHATGIPYFDGAASVLIGLLLCCVAIILLRETKGLLVGEGMSASELGQIRGIVEADPAIRSCGRILTMYMGPQHLIVAIDASFEPNDSAQEVLTGVDRVESAVRVAFPQADNIFVEAEGLKQVQRQRNRA